MNINVENCSKQSVCGMSFHLTSSKSNRDGWRRLDHLDSGQGYRSKRKVQKVQKVLPVHPVLPGTQSGLLRTSTS